MFKKVVMDSITTKSISNSRGIPVFMTFFFNFKVGQNFSNDSRYQISIIYIYEPGHYIFDNL